MQCTDECVCWLACNGSYMHTRTLQCLLVMGMVSLSKYNTPNVYPRPVCVLFIVHAHFAVQFMSGNIYLIQNTFGVKKARPSKVESYLEVNT